MPAADLCPLKTCLAGREAGLNQEELMEDQTPHRRLEAHPLRRKVDLVYRVVQIRQTVTHEHIGRQRVQDAARRVEGAVDERTHPARLYTLVDGVDGDEASRVRSFVARGIIDDLDAPGDYLDAVAALDLARDYDLYFGKKLVQKPAPSPDGHRDIAGAVVELGGEPGSAAPDRLTHRAGRDDRAEDRGPFSDAQLGDPLHVG